MNAKHKILIALFSASLFCISCKKILDKTPVSNIPPEKFFKNVTQAQGVVIGTYDALQVDANWLLARSEARSDAYSLTGTSNAGPAQNLYTNNLTNDNPQVKWASFWNAINNANNVIKFTPLIDVGESALLQNQRFQLEAEGRFLRAWSYYYLIRTWRNIPLITEPFVSLAESNIPYEQHFYDKGVNFKTTRDAVVMWQIMSDLQFARKYLPENFGSSVILTRGRATRGAAYALSAGVALWRATFEKESLPDSVSIFLTQTKNYADTVLLNPLYSLMPGAQYGSIFSTKNSNESIWELQFNALTNETNGILSLVLPRAAGGRGGGLNLAPNPKLIPTTPGGTGYADIEVTTGTGNSAVKTIYKDLRRDASIQPTTINGQLIAPWNNTADRNRYYVNKYFGTVNETGGKDADDNIKLIRLADVILMKAEALYKLNMEAESLAELNKIRRRAYGFAPTAISPVDYTPANLPVATATQPGLFLAIEQERLLELAFEGHRWFDLIRTDRIYDLTPAQYWDTPDEVERLRVFPIQRDQLVQTNYRNNPGYAGN